MEDKDESKQNFGRTILDYIDRGVEASKKGLKSAGSAITEFSDKSVLKIELSQLKAQLARNFTELGKTCYNLLKAENAEPISPSNDEIKKLLEAIAKTEEKIAKHEEALKKGKSPEAKEDGIVNTDEAAPETAEQNVGDAPIS